MTLPYREFQIVYVTKSPSGRSACTVLSWRRRTCKEQRMERREQLSRRAPQRQHLNQVMTVDVNQ